MLADAPAKDMKLTAVVAKFLAEQKCCIARSKEEQEKDAYRLT